MLNFDAQSASQVLDLGYISTFSSPRTATELQIPTITASQHANSELNYLQCDAGMVKLRMLYVGQGRVIYAIRERPSSHHVP